MADTNTPGCDALDSSWRIQSEVSARGFDWPDITGVFAKVREELEEVESAWGDGDRQGAGRELGDLLFAAVNLGRFLGAHPEEALDRANRRFLARFSLLETQLQSEGRRVENCTLKELDTVWERIKKCEVPGPETGAKERA